MIDQIRRIRQRENMDPIDAAVSALSCIRPVFLVTIAERFNAIFKDVPNVPRIVIQPKDPQE